MSLTDKGLWLLERVDDVKARCPVVVVRRSEIARREKMCFMFGRESAGIYDSPQPPTKGRRGHLHAV